ncbi:polysaccharide deacetylase family protein [Paenibacillus crassostreae]|uniref:Polysaccharide deacetylase n=1 Tax=Paenibacillus crassostreae TaxID=1763538 RepID=A0A167BBA2_9BACL|nr:polysaccharide deacetylase family protein [Paenibacillus crassostreae]AOZ93000.1 polysaccharide deacetylase [Paenibacillus crassostreae]OAB71911.1 polysaccharide deacetylase [Paenibacillus crassostreae]
MSKAYLTIDDGPTTITRQMIDYLTSKNITPILFFYGQQMEKHFEEGVYALQQGAVIGNHSYSHPCFNDITFDECVSEIEQQEEWMTRLHEVAGVERQYKLFRFPYGAKGGKNKVLIQDYLRENGFNRIDDRAVEFDGYKNEQMNLDIDVFWTFDFAEYQLHNADEFTYESIIERIHDSNPQNGAVLLEENTNHIILLHDHENTEALIPEYYKILIDYVMEQGVEFVNPKFVI